VVAVYGGSRTTCALRADSKVSCWGSNGYLQAGYSSNSNQQQAVDLGVPVGESVALEGVIAVSSGVAMSCGLRGDGSVLCWGSNANGELAINTTSTVTEIPRFCQLPVM
jgi:alpha-tubulin suppressor-like RCC1 family protein